VLDVGDVVRRDAHTVSTLRAGALSYDLEGLRAEPELGERHCALVVERSVAEEGGRRADPELAHAPDRDRALAINRNCQRTFVVQHQGEAHWQAAHKCIQYEKLSILTAVIVCSSDLPPFCRADSPL
jgi:hypothetical protein